MRQHIFNEDLWKRKERRSFLRVKRQAYFTLCDGHGKKNFPFEGVCDIIRISILYT